jgi:hypothetical protein
MMQSGSSSSKLNSQCCEVVVTQVDLFVCFVVCRRPTMHQQQLAVVSVAANNNQCCVRLCAYVMNLVRTFHTYYVYADPRKEIFRAQRSARTLEELYKNDGGRRQRSKASTRAPKANKPNMQEQ